MLATEKLLTYRFIKSLIKTFISVCHAIASSIPSFQPQKEKIDPKQNKLDSFGFGAGENDDITEVKPSNGNCPPMLGAHYIPSRHFHMANRRRELSSTRHLIVFSSQALVCRGSPMSSLSPNCALRLLVYNFSLLHCHSSFFCYKYLRRLCRWFV